MALPVQLAGDLSASQVAFSKVFLDAREAAQPLWVEVATRVPSTTKTQKYPFAARVQRLRQWQGERIFENGKVYTQSIDNERYSSGLRIPIDDFEDDTVGIWAPIVADMGQQAAYWPDDLIFDAIKNGATSGYNAYDGVTFFSDSHALKSGSTIDNNFASTALTADNLAAVIETMMAYVGEDGRSLRVRPNRLFVPPALMQEAYEASGSSLVAKVFGTNTAAAAIENVLKGMVQVVIVPDLATAAGGSDTTWYVADCSKPVKPMVFQERMAPAFRQLTADAEHAFKEDEVLYGVKARGNAAYGQFYLISRAAA